MSPHSISSEQHRWLEQELAVWEAQEVIAPDAAARIRGLYDAPDNASAASVSAQQRLFSLAIFTTLALAALLAGLAVLLVVCYNWESLLWQQKLVILFGALLSANVSGVVLRLRQQKNCSQENYSEVAFFFGSLLFGVCIWQIAQIFHIRTHYPEGMLMWSLGVLPLALCARTPLLHVLTAILLSIWCGWEILGYERGLFIFSLFGTEWSIDHGAYSLPLWVTLGLWWGYKNRSEIVVGIYAATLIWWLCLGCDTLNLHWAGCWYILLIGIAAAYFGEGHKKFCGGRFAKFARPWQLLGTRLFAAVLVPMTFWVFHAERQIYFMRALTAGDTHGHNHDIFIYVSNCVMLTLAILVFFALAYLTARKNLRNRQEEIVSDKPRAIDGRWLPPMIFGSCGLAALVSLIQMTNATFLAEAVHYSRAARPENIFTAGPFIFGQIVTINAAMVFTAFYLILRGLSRQHMSIYFAGVGYFLLWVILRYFDLFGGHGAGAMLGAAALFFLCAVALAGTVLFWKRAQQ